MGVLRMAVAAVVVAACGGAESSEGDGGIDASTPGGDAATTDAQGGALPTANARFDYQLGGGYDPAPGVEMVVRDRTDVALPELYSVCYVNGFQTQPGERDFWIDNHPDLLLRDAGGQVVIDPDWDEIILDVTSAEKRAALADIVGEWISGCAGAGFNAVEIDNLDTYSRSGDRVSQDDAVAFMSLLAARAHGLGLPIAQKNSAEVLSRQSEMTTDFAVVEECNRFDECGVFTEVYGDQVFVIEYRQGDFDRGCRDFPGLSIVLRDLDLVRPTDGGYVFDDC